MLPLVIVVQHTELGTTKNYAFADSPVRLGRSPFAELQFDEEFVSRWEGTLRFGEDQVTYFNLSATNPTFVNGRQVAPNEEISVTSETIIAIGKLNLRFLRMPVPEADLRRRGKRMPVAPTERGEMKTVWLGANHSQQDMRAAAVAASAAKADGARPAAKPPEVVAKPAPSTPPAEPTPPSQAAAPSSVRPAAASERPPGSDSVRAMQAVTIGRSHVIAPASEPAPAPTEPPPSASSQSSIRPPYASVPPSSTYSSVPGPANVETQHARYREAWESLLVELTHELENAAEADRVALSDRLQRRYPQITQEPGFRAVLKRLGLEARKPDIPEIGEWLRTVAEGVLPPQFRLDTGLTLERIFGLLEILSESLADLNEAQDSVRKKWLGRVPRGSVLQSDNGRVILAYLLNPRSDWNERVTELEESLRNMVMHEIALFKATMEGAKGLLEALSPEAIAKAEEIDLAGLEESSGGGLWQRLKREDPRASLWNRFVATYESLKDGARYQRVFMGRPFARTYLAAMGQGETTDGGQSTTS